MDKLEHPFDLTSPTAPQAKPPGPPPEPFGMLDLEEPPETYGVDDVCVLPRDPTTLFVYWEVTDRGRAGARAHLGGDGQLVLRIYSVSPGGNGPVTDTADYDLGWDHGRRYVPAMRPGAHVSAAIGLRSPDGRFAPISHAERLRVPYDTLGPEGPVEWMEVVAGKSRGLRLERPEIIRRGTLRVGAVPWGRHHAAPAPSSASMPSSPWRWRKPEDQNG